MSRRSRAGAALRARYRLALAALAGVVLVGLGLAFVVARNASPTAEDLDCARRYAQARSAADTARVDAGYPAAQGRGGVRGTNRPLLTLSCGARRRSGGTAGPVR
jgi:hypothetical protein